MKGSMPLRRDSEKSVEASYTGASNGVQLCWQAIDQCEQRRKRLRTIDRSEHGADDCSTRHSAEERKLSEFAMSVKRLGTAVLSYANCLGRECINMQNLWRFMQKLHKRH